MIGECTFFIFQLFLTPNGDPDIEEKGRVQELLDLLQDGKATFVEIGWKMEHR